MAEEVRFFLSFVSSFFLWATGKLPAAYPTLLAHSTLTRFSLDAHSTLTRRSLDAHSAPCSKPEVRVVADLGCGDAEIARAMDAPSKGANKKTVHNFDLWQNSRGNVTVCNIADVPLPDGSVDACVFCLSLMGTDYGAFLVEAARILRGGGHLWIAEVTSRAVQRAEGFNIVPDLVAAIEALGFCCVSKRVGEGSYFFELVFAVDVGRRKKSVQFPELRACAYKKR